MKKLLALSLALASTLAVAGEDPQYVGWCGAYHLMMGNHREVSEVTRMTSDISQMQYHARELVREAKSDPKGAAAKGRYACRKIGFRT